VSSGVPSRRFVVGLAGTGLLPEERRLLGAAPPFGVLLFPRNLVEAEQTAALVSEVKALGDPSPLVFVDQEGGAVDRLGPLLGVPFPSPEACAARGAQDVHDAAYLMGRAARILGIDADFAPAVDLAQPGAGAKVLAGRCFGFHAEDVTLAGTVFPPRPRPCRGRLVPQHFPGLRPRDGRLAPGAAPHRRARRGPDGDRPGPVREALPRRRRGDGGARGLSRTPRRRGSGVSPPEGLLPAAREAGLFPGWSTPTT